MRQYKTLIADLQAYYNSNEENSISEIILDTIWYDTLYRTFNEGIRLMWQKGKEEKLPKSLIDYIHLTHANYMLLNLRKLFDKKDYGKRKVNSLQAIINKIQANRGSFTRYNYVCYDDMPYECPKEETRGNWKVIKTVQWRNKVFDLLCGKSDPSRRTDEDTLQAVIVNNLIIFTTLDENVAELIDNYIAHAGDIGRTKSLGKEEKPKVTLLKIQQQIRVAIWAIQVIGKIIDSHIPTEVPAASFDKFEHWEKSIFDSSIKQRLNNYWKQRCALWRKWTYTYWDHNKLFLTPYKELKPIT